ncbi:lysozyme-like [Anneissia japonica]|uniref:lysozyme-like n=1 Tax=Anneissia japonica TaxID=1529436 RepID=UPI0014258ED6|nr:lysozyme-like [Anneissia japonica]
MSGSGRTFIFTAGGVMLILLVHSSAAYISNQIGTVPADCLQCICIVESNCQMPNPVCSMDVGSLSCGPYQIKEAYWIDARLKGGSLDGSWKNCTKTFDCSERAVQGYMARYAISSRLGHQPTCEDFARIHNGGPNGFKNPNTLGYWAKVQKCLNKSKQEPQTSHESNRIPGTK